jgi:predicted MFS family arabinose efflux permease
LGGWLLATFDWRAVFAVEIPLAFIGGIVAFFVLPPEGPQERRRQPFDLPGAVFIFGAVAGLLVAGNRLPSLGITSPIVLGPGGGGLLFLGLFFWRETRAANPVLDLSLLRIPGVSLPTLGLILQMFSFAVAVSLVPFFLEGALRLSPAQAGAVFAVSAVGLFLGSFPGGILYDRFGVRRVAVVTLAAMALAFAGLTMLSETSGIVPVIVILGVIGLMEGAFQSSTSAALLGAVPTERLSTASALFVVGIMLPLSAGLILGGTLLTTRLAVHEAALGAGPAAVAAAYHEVALMGTAFALAALLVHLLFGRFVQRKRQE